MRSLQRDPLYLEFVHFYMIIYVHLYLSIYKPALNHDIICPAAFTIHALANTVITNESNIFITGKLAALIRVDD